MKNFISSDLAISDKLVAINYRLLTIEYLPHPSGGKEVKDCGAESSKKS